jgi:hypothetical protein
MVMQRRCGFKAILLWAAAHLSGYQLGCWLASHWGVKFDDPLVYKWLDKAASQADYVKTEFRWLYSRNGAAIIADAKKATAEATHDEEAAKRHKTFEEFFNRQAIPDYIPQAADFDVFFYSPKVTAPLRKRLAIG